MAERLLIQISLVESTERCLSMAHPTNRPSGSPVQLLQDAAHAAELLEAEEQRAELQGRLEPEAVDRDWFCCMVYGDVLIGGDMACVAGGAD